MKAKGLLISLSVALAAVALTSCGVANAKPSIPDNGNDTSEKDQDKVNEGNNNETKDENNSSQIEEKNEEVNNQGGGSESSNPPSSSSNDNPQSGSSEGAKNPAPTQNSEVPTINIPTVDKGNSDLVVLEASGNLESAYVEFEPVEGASSYNAYIKKGNGEYTKLDKELLRKYKSFYRYDAVGLTAGSYTLKVAPVINNEEKSAVEIKDITVLAHERAGFGFVNGTSSGAYNDDGTLRSDAEVVYVTNANKDTVTVSTTAAVGIQNIIAAYKKEVQKPLCVRFIGNIDDPANMPKGDLYVDGVTNGLTLEGIGEDANINGFGIVIKASSNVEVRNLGFMNCNSSEGDDCGLQQDNNHVWVHNCDFFYGDAGSDADQAKGDGALDTKKSTYVTHSYNHFWDNGKCNLQGMKDEKVTNYITYHHNWYDHSDSRHPRIRTCTVHIYNNYFDGNAKYGVGVTLGASAFVENNYFRSDYTMKPMLSSLQGTDAKGSGTFSGENGGIIKSFNNKFDGKVSYITQNDVSNGSFDAYEATSRNEQVPSSIKAIAGGSTYNNFDTSAEMYSYTVDTPDVAREKVMKFAGRINGGDFKYSFEGKKYEHTYKDENKKNVTEIVTADAFYGLDEELKSLISNYKSSIVATFTGENSNSQAPSSNDNPTQQAATAQDVIALITALPEAASVTASNRANITNARAAYEALSAEEKANVTNLSKLTACEAALAALPQEAMSIVFTDAKGDSNFKVTANMQSKPAAKTYEGVTYSTCIKMESSTSISFNATGKITITIITSLANGKVKINGTSYAAGSDGVLIQEIEANGTVTITKGDTMNVYAISVK